MTKWRVTKPVTKHGVYYAAGEIYDDSSSVVGSLQRIFHWEKVDDPKPKAAAASRKKVSSRKPTEKKPRLKK